jgi:hypothetical protein
VITLRSEEESTLLLVGLTKPSTDPQMELKATWFSLSIPEINIIIPTTIPSNPISRLVSTKEYGDAALPDLGCIGVARLLRTLGLAGWCAELLEIGNQRKAYFCGGTGATALAGRPAKSFHLLAT